MTNMTEKARATVREIKRRHPNAVIDFCYGFGEVHFYTSKERRDSDDIMQHNLRSACLSNGIYKEMAEGDEW